MLGGSIPAAGSAAAATIEADTAVCTVSGVVNTALPIGPVPFTGVSFNTVLAFNCTGTGDDAGGWSVAESGFLNVASCEVTGGTANVDGGSTSSDGAVTGGTAHITGAGPAVTVAGTIFTDGDRTGHTLAGVLAITPNGNNCFGGPTSSFSVTGAVDISDIPEVPEPGVNVPTATVCQLVGTEFYNVPGGPLPTNVGVGGGVTLVCLIAPGNDDGGTWTLSFGGNGTELCNEGVDNLSVGGSSPEGTVSGTMTIGRELTAFVMIASLTVGSSSEPHTLVAAGLAIPNPICPIGMESLQGAGVMVDG